MMDFINRYQPNAPSEWINEIYILDISFIVVHSLSCHFLKSQIFCF
jgi:hypothetical protein